MTRSVVVFDLGGVLIDWNPRHLYRQLAGGDEARIEWFLANVCTHEWNQRQDAGRTFAEAAALLKAEHPDHVEWIDLYGQRFGEMLSGPIDGTVAILKELKARGTPLFALTNWSAETFPIALERFDFLGLFDGILVSGVEKLIKPDPRIFHLIADRHGFQPSQAIFIDDVAKNVEAAASLGFHAIQFSSPESLRAELVGLRLLWRFTPSPSTGEGGVGMEQAVEFPVKPPPDRALTTPTQPSPVKGEGLKAKPLPTHRTCRSGTTRRSRACF